MAGLSSLDRAANSGVRHGCCAAGAGSLLGFNATKSEEAVKCELPISTCHCKPSQGMKDIISSFVLVCPFCLSEQAEADSTHLALLRLTVDEVGAKGPGPAHHAALEPMFIR